MRRHHRGGCLPGEGRLEPLAAVPHLRCASTEHIDAGRFHPPLSPAAHSQASTQHDPSIESSCRATPSAKHTLPPPAGATNHRPSCGRSPARLPNFDLLMPFIGDRCNTRRPAVLFLTCVCFTLVPPPPPAAAAAPHFSQQARLCRAPPLDPQPDSALAFLFFSALVWRPTVLPFLKAAFHFPVATPAAPSSLRRGF